MLIQFWIWRPYSPDTGGLSSAVALQRLSAPAPCAAHSALFPAARAIAAVAPCPRATRLAA
ncbi:hypothetical protein RR11_1106 [Ruegeria sp. R11]|nr:hypothetical protein RR11_1106 [Ruegeria sp. R11]